MKNYTFEVRYRLRGNNFTFVEGRGYSFVWVWMEFVARFLTMRKISNIPDTIMNYTQSWLCGGKVAEDMYERT